MAIRINVLLCKKKTKKTKNKKQKTKNKKIYIYKLRHKKINKT